MCQLPTNNNQPNGTVSTLYNILAPYLASVGQNYYAGIKWRTFNDELATLRQLNGLFGHGLPNEEGTAIRVDCQLHNSSD